MSKIVKATGEEFEFSFTSSEKYLVTPEGIEVPDEVAAVMSSRFAVEIEEGSAKAEVDPEEIAPEVAPETPAEVTTPEVSAEAEIEG